MRGEVRQVLGKHKPDPSQPDDLLSFANQQALRDLLHVTSPNANNVRWGDRHGPRLSQRSRSRNSPLAIQCNPSGAVLSFPIVAIHLPHLFHRKLWRQEDR